MSSPDPKRWKRGERLDTKKMPRDRPARILLFVHGRAGNNVSHVTAEGRKKARADGDATWLAYAVYGHPLAALAP